jgi:hypothetical protein
MVNTSAILLGYLGVSESLKAPKGAGGSIFDGSNSLL